MIDETGLLVEAARAAELRSIVGGVFRLIELSLLVAVLVVR